MKILLLSLLVLTTSCTFKEPNFKSARRRNIKVYDITCRHPIKKFVTYTIKNTGRPPFREKSGIWDFTDLKGKRVVTDLGCYMDSSSKRVIKK